MRIFKKILLPLSFLLILSCTNKKSDNKSNGVVSKEKVEKIKVGGLYTSKDKNGAYGITKILALDEYTVHIRMYSDKFTTKPLDVKSSDLNYMIGHAPIAKEGFLKDDRELITIEKVSDKELEGYNYYLEAMKNQ